jgi:hypothetical protein
VLLLVLLVVVASFGLPRIIHNATAGHHSRCLPGRLPQAAWLNGAEIQEAVEVMGLKALVGAGTVDSWGVQYPMSAWSDAHPGGDPAEMRTPARMPGGYEIRWFSPERDYEAVDLFVFASSADAAEYVRQAASSRCHQDAASYPVTQPAGGRALVWHNPDGALQADVFFSRFNVAYRVAEVPPGVQRHGPSGAGPPPILSIPERLACQIRQAACREPASP